MCSTKTSNVIACSSGACVGVMYRSLPNAAALYHVQIVKNGNDRRPRYRNLSGLSAAQLEWIRKNHMQPVDSNPPWAENRPKNNADGVLWLSENRSLALTPQRLAE